VSIPEFLRETGTYAGRPWSVSRPLARANSTLGWTLALLVIFVLSRQAWCQSAQLLNWQTIRARFEANNPTLLAAKTNIDEARAKEITAYLRPNPQFTMTVDGTQIAPNRGVWQPFTGTFESPAISYLHERQHKRQLRLESAKRDATIEQWDYSDLERTLLFNVRSAFVSTLQAKAVLELANDNLAYYDHVLQISRDRFSAGDLSRVDLDRLELQRVQYESDVETAEVNLRTAKIQLLTFLNDRTPIEQFDITGTYDYSDQLLSRDEYRKIAVDNRPDLKAAMETVTKAQTDHQLAIANGSTDPTFSAWYTHNSSNNNPFGLNTLGVSVSVPLRIFDRNQGEKLRTQLDVTRSQELREATVATVLSDVDSGYAMLESNLNLLRPYKQKYLAQATRVRDTIFFSYQHGGASLLDFMNAQSEYRAVRLSYVNLIGSYLTTAAQLNMAVGQEVIP
jgi:cobalt-zinc-cadmium efflux system outer membrane protein